MVEQAGFWVSCRSIIPREDGVIIMDYGVTTIPICLQAEPECVQRFYITLAERGIYWSHVVDWSPDLIQQRIAEVATQEPEGFFRAYEREVPGFGDDIERIDERIESILKRADRVQLQLSELAWQEHLAMEAEDKHEEDAA